MRSLICGCGDFASPCRRPVCRCGRTGSSTPPQTWKAATTPPSGCADLEGSYHAAFGLLSMQQRPDAVICGSNLLAFGLYQVAAKQGLNIPEEMALITFDRYPYSTVLDPLPTFVQIDVHDLGRTAGAMMLRVLKRPELLVQTYATLPQLVCNATTPYRPRPSY